MVIVVEGDIMKEQSEAIVNSIGGNVQSGFGGYIGGCMVDKYGKQIITDAVNEAQSKYGSPNLDVGQFVSTSISLLFKLY